MRLMVLLLLLFPLTSVRAEEVKLLFLGDSLTAGYGISMENAFPSQVGKMLEKENVKVKIINGGQSGATSASGLKRFNWYMRAKPDVLILALGANDGLRSLPPEETEKNLTEIVRKAKAAGLKVVLAGMQMPPNYGPEYTKKYKALFPRVAEKEETAFIPFLLEGVGGEPEMNLPDQIHPNEKGHQVIAKMVVKKIKEVLNAPRP